MTVKARFRPSRRAIALEPRLLFDGAAAVAGADAFVDDPGETDVDHIPQTQNDEQDQALLNLFETMSDDNVGISIDSDADDLFVSEPSDLNDDGADTVIVNGWQLEGSDEATVTVTVTLNENASGSLHHPDGLTFTGSVADAEDWLNSLVFTAADVELGNTAETVTVTATVNGDPDVFATRDITITPSNDPATLDNVEVNVTEGGTFNFTDEHIKPDDPEVYESKTQDSTQLVYRLLGEPEYGYLTLDGVRLGEGSIFTQEDIEKGLLSYVHTAGGTDDQNKTDSFELRINDGATPIELSDKATITLKIDAVNQAPSIGGSGIVYEGQPRDAHGTGSVGQYITGSTGGDPSDVLNSSVVRITSLPSGGTLYFRGTATIGENGEPQSIDRAITQADIDAGFTFEYSQKDGLSYERTGGIINDEGPATDSFKLEITDQGGGADNPLTESGTVELTVLPVNDDPILGAIVGNEVVDPTLNAAVPDNDTDGSHAVVLTPGMIGARDVDTVDRNIRFVVDYNDSDLEHGYLQLWIEGDEPGEGTWYNLPSGESFSMHEIREGHVRYIQTSNAELDETDNFTFTVIDSTNALRWDADGSTYDRIGGIYENPESKDSPLESHDFVIHLTDKMDGDDGRLWDDLERAPHSNDSTHAGHKPGESGKGVLVEGGDVVLKGTDHNDDDPFLSYEATGIDPDDVIYTFDGFSNTGGSSNEAGELQIKNSSGDWVALNQYDTFTQADLNDGNIRFKHDGDSEKFASTALFTVSAGVMREVDGTWTQDFWTPEFTFYITPVNDAPVAEGSDDMIIREGETAHITDEWLSITDPDDATSDSALWSEGEDGINLDDDDTLYSNEDENYAADHTPENPLLIEITGLEGGGTWEYWDGEEWVELTVGKKIDSALLKTAIDTDNEDDNGPSGIRFRHDGSESREASITVKAIDRWGESSDPATVEIQITNVNDGPLIPKTPDHDPQNAPDEYDGSGSNIGPNKSANNPVRVYEGATVKITSDELQAIDSDSTSLQVQYKITEAPKYGDILLDGKKLGVGSSFTQNDIDEDRVKYVHRGRDTPAGDAPDSYNDLFRFTLSDGDQEQVGNEFWILVDPTNDPPTVTVPSGPQKTGSDGVNQIPGVSVGDTDWTIENGETKLDRDEENFIQVTVRLIDNEGAVVNSGFTFDVGDPGDTGGENDKWKAVDENGLLVLQGTREQVNAALADLTVTFESDEDAIYTLEVIADDRLRDSDGKLLTGDAAGANGGKMNQGATPGAEPDPIDTTTEYTWSSADVQVESNHGNIVSKTITLWSSRDNDTPELTVPGDIVDVYEDVRSQIGKDFDFVVSDAESEAFDTNVTLTITVPGDQGILHIGAEGAAGSFTPADGQSVTVSGQGGQTLTLTGRASDIQAILNETGLFYTSPENENHDLNGGADGDVTVSFTLAEIENESAIGTGETQSVTSTVALNIVAVNDAPEVRIGDEQIVIDSDQPISVVGVSIYDVDADDGYEIDDGYAEGEEDGIIQVIVRLQREDVPNSGTYEILKEQDYETLGITINSTESPTVTPDSPFTVMGDQGDEALILRGTKAQINAYLAGLQIQFETSDLEQTNVDRAFRLEVIVDDRLRDTDGDLTAGANGGDVNQDDNLLNVSAVPGQDNFNIYETDVNTYNIFNVVSDTRDIFVSSINDPGKITAENVTVDEGFATITLDTSTSDFQIDDPDHNGSTEMVTTVTVGAGTITAVGTHADKVEGLNTSEITITNATQDQINDILNSLTITFPGSTDIERADWNGSFDVTVVYNDMGNTGLRPGQLTDDTDEPREGGGDFAFGDPDSDTDPALVTTRIITVTVNPVNDAPVVIGEGNATLEPVMEDTEGLDANDDSTAQTIEELFADRFQDDRDNVENGSDSDTFLGVAVVDNTSVPGQGVWQYHNGSTWVDIPTDLSDGNALILEKTTQVRFNPADDFHGTPGRLTVRLVEVHGDDDDQTSSRDNAINPETGATVNLRDEGGLDTNDPDNSSLYSSGTIELTTTVTNVNDAPSLTGGATLGNTAEDDGPSNAMTAKQIADRLEYSDARDNVSPEAEEGGVEGGEDASSALTAIAITGNNADPVEEGKWYYTLDGTTWTEVPANVGDGSAIVLDVGNTNHQIRFEPVKDYNGTPGSLTVRGADETWTGTAGPQDISSIIGGAHPWSEDNGTVGIVVTPVNDAPHFTHAPTNPTVTENDQTGAGTSVPPTFLLGPGEVSDIDLETTPELDDATFGAGTITVTLTGGFEDSGDVLNIDDLPGIKDVTGGTGDTPLVITLSDSATLTQVEAILAAITYENTSDNPTNYGEDKTRGYTITLNDGKNVQGENDSGGGEPEEYSVSGTITINAVNDPPTAHDDTNSLVRTEDDLSGNVIKGEHTSGDGTEKTEGTDEDPDTPIDDLRLTTIKVTTVDGGDTGVDFGDDYTEGEELELKGKYGTLYIDSEGGYRYVVDQNNPAVYGLHNDDLLVEEFEYTLTDGDPPADGLPTATLTITIHGDNIVPPAITPVDHTSDIDGDNIVHEAGLRPESEIDDDTGEAFATGEINVNAPGGIKSVEIGGKTIDLQDLKDATTDTPITIYSGTSEDDSVWKLEIIGFVPGEFDEGTTEPESAPRVGEITYRFTLLQPVENDEGADHHDENIPLTVTDQADQEADGTLTIRIIDDEPKAAADEETVDNHNNKATGNALDNDILGADRDVFVTDITGPKGAGTADGDGVITVEGEHGTLVIEPTGEFTYTRHDGEPLTATEVFNYTITDNDGDESPATITIHINDKGPEVTGDGSGTPPVEEPVDPDDPSGEQRLIIKPDGKVNESGLPDGSTSGDNSQITTGTIHFDKGDGEGDDHTVTITDKDNNPVELTGTPGQAIDTPYGTVTITEFDPESGTIEYTYELKHPTDGEDTTDEFEVTIKDEDGDTTSVTVVIDIINDDPFAKPDTDELTFGDEDTTSGNVFTNDNIGADGEPDNGPVTGIASGEGGTPSGNIGEPVGGQYGTIEIDSEGNYTYTPDPANDTLLNLPGGESVDDVFTYTITDADGDTSTATLTITIHGNTPPVAEPDTLTIPEDTVGTGNVLENDWDDDEGDELTVTGFTIEGVPGDHGPGIPVDIPGVGTITIDEDGDYSFTPVKDWNGDVPVITYTVTDGKGERGTTTSTLTITVTPVPDAVDDSVTTESGMPITFDPTDNDSFSNPDKTITEVTQGSNGTVTITPDGRVTYTPNPGFEGTDTFTYTVTSGGITETATVTVTVRGQHVHLPPPAYGDYTPPSLTPDVTGSPLMRSVVRDPSVYFLDESFDRVDRMQLPFHPITYVNRQVQMSQDERAESDVRGYSDPRMTRYGQIQSTSIGAGLGFDPNLFVQHAVRDTQDRADFLARVVDGRLGRIALSSDRALPTPDLFEADVNNFLPKAPQPADAPGTDQPDTQAESQETPAEAAGDQAEGTNAPDNVSGETNASGDDLALHNVSGDATDIDTQADSVALIGSGAPSFSEQLRGGSTRLPATLFSPHKAV